MTVNGLEVEYYSVLMPFMDAWCSDLFASRRRHTRCALVTGVQTCALPIFGSEAKRDVGHDQQRDHPVKGDRHRLIAASRLQHLGPPLPPTQAHRPPGSTAAGYLPPSGA